MSKKPLTVVDLFAGCGGLSLGLEQAGFQPVFVNELNKDAMESYLLNRQQEYPYLREDVFHCNDVKELVLNKTKTKKIVEEFKSRFGLDINSGDLDLVVGGPPCQGFSGIGHRRSYKVDKEQLPSNHLYQDMAYVISLLKPKIFLFENVKGLLSAKWTPAGLKGEIWEDVQNTFKELNGYVINSALVKAKDYGVAQNRPRVLLVGIRKDIFTASKSIIKGSVADGFLPEPTGGSHNLDDLLGDLVDLNYENGGTTKKYVKPAITEIQKYYRQDRLGKISPKGALLTEHDYSVRLQMV